MANFGLRNLCTPAYIYLVISLISLFIILIQNQYNSTTYCMGNYSCKVSSITLVFVVKIIYILIWTWILNLICIAGAPIISWALLIIPFVLMFLFIAMFITYSSTNIPVEFI